MLIPDFKTKYLSLTREKKLIQVFPEVCNYSCSKNGEKRNFLLLREYYEFRFWKFKLKFLESVKILCDNCGWSSSIPDIFAKKIFKTGVKSHLLVKYSKNRIITSRFLNIWGHLWRIWIIALGILSIITIIRFNSEPVLLREPKEISFQESFSGENLGEIVKIKGKVDYNLTLSKEIFIEENDRARIISQEVYLPLFPSNNLSDFIVIRGGTEEIKAVAGRSGITNYEVLKNQDYSITGRLELIENLKGSELNKYFREDLPKNRSLNSPKLLINSVDLKSFKDFTSEFIPFYAALLGCLISSIIVQIYIEKRIGRK